MYYYIVTNLQELLHVNNEEPLSLYQVQGNGISQDKTTLCIQGIQALPD